MCGIAAIISSSQDYLRCIRPMTDLVRHRGPDDEGFLYLGADGKAQVVAGPDTPATVRESTFRYAPRTEWADEIPSSTIIALGHRRLSIVDLSPAGHQPMCDTSERYWIVYNGEIYNYIELRKELETLGHPFVSHTDTEVLLAAYAQWGSQCLTRLNGMWAFVLVDTHAQTLFASCDRFGIKQLYYHVFPTGIALASEIKQFTALPGWQAQANRARCLDYLRNGIFDHGDDTLFANVNRLRGGQLLELDLCQPNQSPTVRSWYSLPETDSTRVTTLDEAAGELQELLADAVQLHLRADVKVGSCLSGGLDSSAIVCLINRQLRAQLQLELQETVSSCSHIARYDERPFIEAVAKQTQVRTHYVFPSHEELFDQLPQIVWHQDEPFGSTSMFAQWNVFAEAKRQGLKVMLDGQGADELLAGYAGFFPVWFRQLLLSFRLRGFAHEVDAWRTRHAVRPRELAKCLASIVGGRRLERLRERNQYKWLKHQPTPSSNGDHRSTSSINALSRFQLLSKGLPTLLHYEDRNSMAHSIEARVPFLDYRVVEYVVSLPDEFKIRNGQSKAVLRQAMKDVLPAAVHGRQDKMGFVTPEEVWLKQEATEQFRAGLLLSSNAAPELFDRQILMNYFDDVVQGRRRFSWSLWRVLCFGQWLTTFNVQLN